MKLLETTPRTLVLAFAAATLLTSGCGVCRRAAMLYQPPPPVAPLGTLSDPNWQIQEANAEASDFVIYQHEFTMNSVRLNMAGEDHVKQIAARLRSDQSPPVVIERSMTTARENTEFKYPIHPNPDLDMRRREVVVACLVELGIPDADQRVVVAPAFAEGYEATEATRAYYRGLMGNYGYGGYGGGFGGGGFGPFSGFGGF